MRTNPSAVMRYTHIMAAEGEFLTDIVRAEREKNNNYRIRTAVNSAGAYCCGSYYFLSLLQSDGRPFSR